jgi:hypothetical protein
VVIELARHKGFATVKAEHAKIFVETNSPRSIDLSEIIQPRRWYNSVDRKRMRESIFTAMQPLVELQPPFSSLAAAVEDL